MRFTTPSRGQLLAGCAALCYAVQRLTIRDVAPLVDPFIVALFVGLPTLGVSLALTLGSASRRRRLICLCSLAHGRRLAMGLGLVGALMYMVGNPVFARAMALGGAVVATPSAETAVIWSALLATLILNERLSRLALGGVIAFAVGVLLLAVGQAADVPAGPYWFWSIPLGLVTGLCWASGNIASRLAHAGNVDTYTILSLYGTAGLGGISVVVLVTGKLQAFAGWAVADPEALRVLFVLGLGGLAGLGAQVSLTTALLHEVVARVAVITSTSVTIVAALAWVFLGDTLNVVMLAGILVAFVGAIMVQGRTGGAPGVVAPPVAVGGVPVIPGPAGGGSLSTKRQEESSGLKNERDAMKR